jgi:hypothetical protein
MLIRFVELPPCRTMWHYGRNVVFKWAIVHCSMLPEASHTPPCILTRVYLCLCVWVCRHQCVEWKCSCEHLWLPNVGQYAKAAAHGDSCLLLAWPVGNNDCSPVYDREHAQTAWTSIQPQLTKCACYVHASNVSMVMTGRFQNFTAPLSSVLLFSSTQGEVSSSNWLGTLRGDDFKEQKALFHH